MNTDTQKVSYVYADLLEEELGVTDAAAYEIKMCNDVSNINGVFVQTLNSG